MKTKIDLSVIAAFLLDFIVFTGRSSLLTLVFFILTDGMVLRRYSWSAWYAVPSALLYLHGSMPFLLHRGSVIIYFLCALPSIFREGSVAFRAFRAAGPAGRMDMRPAAVSFASVFAV
jgi:hypothetical protein